MSEAQDWSQCYVNQAGEVYLAAYQTYKKEVMAMILSEASKSGAMGYGPPLQSDSEFVETADGPIPVNTVVAASMDDDGTWFYPSDVQGDTETDPQG